MALLNCLHTFNDHEAEVNSVAFSHDSKMIVSGSDDYTIKLWDVEKYQLLYTFEGYNDCQVSSVAFSYDSKMIVSGAGATGYLAMSCPVTSLLYYQL